MPKFARKEFYSLTGIPKLEQITAVAKQRAKGHLLYPNFTPYDRSLPFPDELEALFEYRLKQFTSEKIIDEKVANSDRELFPQHRNWLINGLLAVRKIEKDFLEKLNDKVFYPARFDLIHQKDEPRIKVDYVPTLGFSITASMVGTLNPFRKSPMEKPCHNFRLRIVIRKIPGRDEGENAEVYAYCLLTHDLFLACEDKFLRDYLYENGWQAAKQIFSSDMDATLFSTKRFRKKLTPHILLVFDFCKALGLDFCINTLRYILLSFLNICENLEKNRQGATLSTLYHVIDKLRDEYNLQPRVCTPFDPIEENHYEKMAALERQIIANINANNEGFILLIKKVAAIVNTRDRSKHLSYKELLTRLKTRLDDKVIVEWEKNPILTELGNDLTRYYFVYNESKSKHVALYKVPHVNHLQEQIGVASNEISSLYHVDDTVKVVHGMSLHCSPTVTVYHMDSLNDDKETIFDDMLKDVASAEGLDLEAHQFLLHRNFKENPLLAFASIKYFLHMETPAIVIGHLVDQFYLEVYPSLLPAQQSDFNELVAAHDARCHLRKNRFVGNIVRDFNAFKYAMNSNDITNEQTCQFFAERYPHLSSPDKVECLDLVLSKRKDLHAQVCGIAEWHNPTLSLRHKLGRKYIKVPAWTKRVAQVSGIVSLGCLVAGVACPATMVTVAGKAALTWGGFGLGVTTAGGHLTHTAIQNPSYSGKKNTLFYDALPESSKPGPQYKPKAVSAPPSSTPASKYPQSSYSDIELNLTPGKTSRASPAPSDSVSITVIHESPVDWQGKKSAKVSPLPASETSVSLEIKNVL